MPAELSVVIPARDESESLEPLFEELVPVLESLGRPWEIVVVDDGSADGTAEVARAVAAGRPEITCVCLGGRKGKAAALSAGFRASTAPIVVTLDADLQDDPKDLPRLLETLESGHDLVCGWRRPRRDPWPRRASSRLFNAATSFLLGPPLHDHNCGFKAFRREVLEEIGLYGDLHRFATFLAHARGFRVTEVPVTHRPRRFGASRYGLERIWRSAFDLFTASMLARGSRRVFRAFATVGVPLALGGLLLCLCLLPAASSATFQRIPLFLAGILALIAGVQICAAGLLCELVLGLWRRRRPGTEKDPHLISILIPGALEPAASRTLETFDRVPDLSCEIVIEGPGGPHAPAVVRGGAAARGSRFILIEPRGLDDLPVLLESVRSPQLRDLLVGPSGAACAGPARLLGEFPGFPRSAAELSVWCASSGRTVVSKGPHRPATGAAAKLRHLPLYFLGRYHSRPLHFFGSWGLAIAAAAVALGLGIKASALDGWLRYALMDLALGAAVAGLQLLVTGLLGELLAYARSAEE